MRAQRAQAQESPASSKDTLPELGRPNDRPGTFSAGPNGARLENTFGRQKVVITPEYSNQTGLSIGGALASMLGENAAVGVLLSAGADKKEWLINAGYQLDARQRFIVTAGQLEQFLDYAFRSGTNKIGMTQNSGALSYQLQLGSEFLRFLEVNGYLAKTASHDLADKTFAVDSATLYELWNDPRRIAGGKVTGLQGKLGFSPLQNSVVKVSLGQERLSYDLLNGTDRVNRLTGGVEWLQQFGSGYQIKTTADTFASQNRYSLGIDRSLAGSGGRHNFGISLVALRGRDGLGDDNQVKLTYNHVFGTGAGSGRAPSLHLHPRASAAPEHAVAWSGSNLLDQVATRPGFIPAHVIAKVDNTALPTRLIAVDKTLLPAGASVDPLTGAISAPLGITVAGIASIIKNLAAFSNTGQFSLAGSSLVINPGLMVQPAIGVIDTYVITLNNLGGGTTLATVLVSHGSVKIDSITISRGDSIPPVVSGLAAGSIDAVSASVSATINEAGTGYYVLLPDSAAPPSASQIKNGQDATGASAAIKGSAAMTANVATVFTLAGMTTSTAYKLYFSAIDSASNLQATVSVSAFSTAAADTTPDSFDIADRAGQPVATVITTNTITVTGINAPVAVSTSVGTLIKNGVNTNAATASVVNGDTLAIQLTTAATLTSPAITGTLTVGTVTDSFSVSTAIIDTIPDAFSFTAQSSVALNTQLESSTITVAGINSPSPISVSGGEYAINGGAWRSTAATVSNGNSVKVRHTSAAANSTAIQTTLTIGGVAGVFTSTTLAAVVATPAPAADVTPPTTTVAPSVSGTIATATTLSVTINETGTGYYLVQAAAAAAPSVAAVQAGTAFAMAANVAATPAISGLTASTAYKIYFVAKDAANNVQAAVQNVAVTTSAAADTTPPTTTAGPTISTAATDTTASVSQTINENGTGYYLVQAAAAAAPTVAAVKAGTAFAMTAATLINGVRIH